MLRRQSSGSRCVAWAATVATLAMATVIGCSEKPAPKPASTEPADEHAAPPAQPPSADASTGTSTVKPAPTTRPALEPPPAKPVASRPASTYDPKPPYPVSLYVLKPEEKQPGWLKIQALDDPDAPATALGTFPVRNKIRIDTENVTRITIHIGHLPLAERNRIVLRIDDQPMEITRRDREYITLERGTAGVWQVVKSARD